MQPFTNDSPVLIQGNQKLFHSILDEIVCFAQQLEPILQKYRDCSVDGMTISDFDEIATLIPKLMWSADALRNFAQMGVFRIVPKDGLSSTDTDSE